MPAQGGSLCLASAWHCWGFLLALTLGQSVCGLNWDLIDQREVIVPAQVGKPADNHELLDLNIPPDAIPNTGVRGRRFHLASTYGDVTTCAHEMWVAAKDNGTERVLIPIHTMWKLVIVNGKAYVRGFVYHDYVTTQALYNKINQTDQMLKEFYLRSQNSKKLYKLPQYFTSFAPEVKTWPKPIFSTFAVDEVDMVSGEFEVLLRHSDEYCQLYAHHVDVKSGPSVPLSIFVMTPMTEGPNVVAPMLHWNIKWHERMGITHHVLYMFNHVTPLTKHPIVQALVDSGKLKLVVWDTTDMHYVGDLEMHDWEDRYETQALMDNHALLSYWPSNTYLVVADVDEFFLTPRPMTFPEVFETCFAPYRRTALDHSGAMSGVCMPRTGVWCLDCDKMDLPPCPTIDRGSYGCEASVWLNTSFTEHPMVHYGLAPDHFDFRQNTMGTKCVSHVPFVPSVDTHQINHGGGEGELKSAEVMKPDDMCVTCLHVTNFYKTRLRPPSSVDPEVYRINETQLWTVLPVQQQQQQQKQQQQQQKQQQGSAAWRQTQEGAAQGRRLLRWWQ